MGAKKAVAVLLLLLVVSVTIVYMVQSDLFFSPSFPKLIYEPTLPSADQKVVCLVFDDGWKTHLDAAAILDNYNFTGTFPIITSYVGYSAYLNWDDIRNLAKKGNDIVSHTQTHASLTALDENALQSELVNSQKVLRSKGYAANILVYPYGEGSSNWTVRNLVSQYYALASTTQSQKCDLSSFDRYNIASYGIYQNTTLQDFATYLTGTQGSNITILFYPKISDENSDTAVTKQVFQQQMQYLSDNGYTVRSLSQEFFKQVPNPQQ